MSSGVPKAVTFALLEAKGRAHAIASVLGAASPSTPISTLREHSEIIAQFKSADELAKWILSGCSPDGLDDYSLRTLRAAVAVRGSLSKVPAYPSESAPSLRLISYQTLRRARTTIADFTRFYLPLHGLADRDFFRWLPMLVFVDCCIYQHHTSI